MDAEVGVASETAIRTVEEDRSGRATNGNGQLRPERSSQARHSLASGEGTKARS